MRKIINIDNHKVIGLSDWDLYLDGIVYNRHDNVDTVFISHWTAGQYKDILLSFDKIYNTVFPNED